MLRRPVHTINSDNLPTETAGFLSIKLLKKEHTLKINSIKNCFVELIIPQELFSEELLQNLKVNRIIIDFKNNVENANHLFALCIAYKYFPFTLNLPSAPAYQQEEFYRGEIQTENKEAQRFLQERTAEDLL